MKNRIQKFYFGNLSSVFSIILLILLTGVAASANIAANVNRAAVADFDGDGKTDISVFRPSDNYWYIAKSSGGFSFAKWGQSGDTIAPGDYDGDGKTDLAVFRRSADSTWYILRSSDNTFQARAWGATSFQQQLLYSNSPVPADYDGDGKTDLAVYRLSDFLSDPGYFIILQSSTNSQTSLQWGIYTDRLIPADYDGDGKTDYAVRRGNTWFILQSSTGTIRIEYFGSGDYTVPADFDGDGKTDIAVWRPSNGYWYWISSVDKSFHSYQFGISEDQPTPGDYDGDGKTDFAVFRPSNGTWYLQQSKEGFRAAQFGLANDIPIPDVFFR